MLRTYKALLKGNQIEWIDEIPETGERSLLVHVTLVEEEVKASSSSRGQKMASILSRLAESIDFIKEDPVGWQREIRQDRQLFNRNDNATGQ